MNTVVCPHDRPRQRSIAARLFLSRLVREKPMGAAAALIFLLFVFCGVFAQWLAPYGYNEISMMERLKPPSWKHPFGTDNLGRDMLSRCLYGAQLSVIIGLSRSGAGDGDLGDHRHPQRLPRRQGRHGGAAHRRCLHVAFPSW